VIRPLPRSTPFPYTTLFRSERGAPPGGGAGLTGAGRGWRRARPTAGDARAERRVGRGGKERVDREGRDAGLQVRRPIPEQEAVRSEEHTSELQSLAYLVCRL